MSQKVSGKKETKKWTCFEFGLGFYFQRVHMMKRGARETKKKCKPDAKNIIKRGENISPRNRMGNSATTKAKENWKTTPNDIKSQPRLRCVHK